MGTAIAPVIATAIATGTVGLAGIGATVWTHRRSYENAEKTRKAVEERDDRIRLEGRTDAANERFRDERLKAAVEYSTAVREFLLMHRLVYGATGLMDWLVSFFGAPIFIFLKWVRPGENLRAYRETSVRCQVLFPEDVRVTMRSLDDAVTGITSWRNYRERSALAYRILDRLEEQVRETLAVS